MGHFHKTGVFQLKNPFYLNSKDVQAPRTLMLSHRLGHRHIVPGRNPGLESDKNCLFGCERTENGPLCLRFRTHTKYGCGEIETDRITNIKKKEDVSSQATDGFQWIESNSLVELDSSRYFLLRLSVRKIA